MMRILTIAGQIYQETPFKTYRKTIPNYPLSDFEKSILKETQNSQDYNQKLLEEISFAKNFLSCKNYSIATK